MGPLAWCTVGDKSAVPPGDDVAPAEAEDAGGASGAGLVTLQVPAAPIAPEVPDGYGEGLAPAALFPGLDLGGRPISPVTGLWAIRRAGLPAVQIMARTGAPPVAGLVWAGARAPP